MTDWPDGPWILLDCSDDVRRQRLTARNEPDDVEEVLNDAANYRALALPVVDTTQLSPHEVSRAVAHKIIETSCDQPGWPGGPIDSSGRRQANGSKLAVGTMRLRLVPSEPSEGSWSSLCGPHLGR